MGAAASQTTKDTLTNSGIIDSKNSGIIGNPDIGIRGDGNLGNTILNATGKPIRLYYGGDKMRLEDIVEEGRKPGDVSGSKTKVIFKPNSFGGYIRIPENNFVMFSGEGLNYASILLEGGSCGDECVTTIVENYSIPRYKSFIVTGKHDIKFQKDGGSFGEDEEGIRHVQEK